MCDVDCHDVRGSTRFSCGVSRQGLGTLHIFDSSGEVWGAARGGLGHEAERLTIGK